MDKKDLNIDNHDNMNKNVGSKENNNNFNKNNSQNNRNNLFNNKGNFFKNNNNGGNFQKNTTNAGNSFADLMKNQNNQQNNNKRVYQSVIEGKVINKITLKGFDYYLIDAGLKYEGIVACNEIESIKDQENIPFVTLKDKDGYILLSHEKAKKEMNIKRIKKYYENKESLSGKVISKTNDGYKVCVLNDINCLLITNEELEISSTITVYVSRIFNNGNINLSLTKQNNNKIKEDSIISGTVISFNDYFVFIDIDDSPMEGIIHFQDLSWDKINFPGEVIAQGQHLKLKVLKVQNNCIYLGLKQMENNPWENIKDKFNDTNKVYEGSIKAINDYELIVDMGDGIQGVIHISESSWGFKKGSSLIEDFKIGQKIQYKIIEIDKSKKRIKLSLKQLTQNPFFEFIEKHKIGDVVEGTILHDPSVYGSFLFIELVKGVDGMLHQSEVDWNLDMSIAKFNHLEKGKKIKVQITNIDKEKMRISISIKRLTPDFFETYAKSIQIGKVYEVEILNVSEDGLNAKVLEFPNCTAFIKRNDISNDKNIRLNSFIPGSRTSAKLISIHNLKRSFLLSIKAQQMDVNKNAIKDNKNEVATSAFGNFLK